MPRTAVCPPGIMNKTGLPLDRIHPVAIVVGDYQWLDLLASLATRQECFSRYKSLCSMELEFNGQSILALSYGYGATNLHRLLVELGFFGVRCVILVTNSFSLVPGRVPKKALCVTYASCRGENASTLEVDLSYPAVAHPDAVRALRQSAAELKLPCHLTRSLTNDQTYTPKVGKPNELRDEISKTGFELEDRDVAPFFVFCSARGMVAGAISCNETEPNKLDPKTGTPIEDNDVIEGRKQAMHIAMVAAAKLSVEYAFTD
ncbi:purine nucleoside phosphorylase [Babesia ovis]|uniref:Purine nucleoside phosphorylase n=1 Tax=Babesia ovis TaxID=5869 RepID=A0A9W5T8B0_BABOV|nr:purine nucleoside phosphorylase [Babesia ovis]